MKQTKARVNLEILCDRIRGSNFTRKLSLGRGVIVGNRIVEIFVSIEIRGASEYRPRSRYLEILLERGGVDRAI